MPIDADKTNATLSRDDHPAHHNTLANAANSLRDDLDGIIADAHGIPGPPGSVGLGINVRDLDADPDAVTDWGTLINDAYAAGARHFLFADISTDHGGTEYPFSTQIDLSDSRGVIFEGDAGLIAVGANDAAGEMVGTRLGWKGTGTTPAINTTGSSGFHMKNLGVFYDSGSFTGKLIEHGATFSSWSVIENCQLGSYENALTSALAIIGWDQSVCQTLRKCLIGGAQWCVLGDEGSGVANANRIFDCMLHSASIGLLGNVGGASTGGGQWEIDGCTFEMGDFGAGITPAVIDSDLAAPGYSVFTLTNCWAGDLTITHTDSIFQQRVDNYWEAAFSGNTFFASGLPAPMFNLQGGGTIRLVNNPHLSSGTAGIVVDMGDIGGGAVAKNFIFEGNTTDNTDDEAITNRDGHNYVVIEGEGAGVYGLRTIEGMERLGHPVYPIGSVIPTIAAESALGSGASAAIAGRDLAGIIRLAPGSGATSGLQATITMSRPYPYDARGELAWQFPLPHLQPLTTAAGHNGANAVAAGLYVEVIEGSDFDTWKIHASDAIATAIAVGYRVIGL